MKKKTLKPLQELKSGLLEGGFTLIASRLNVIVAGLNEPTNNCKEGACTNNCSGGNCGNCVAGCGVKA